MTQKQTRWASEPPAALTAPGLPSVPAAHSNNKPAAAALTEYTLIYTPVTTVTQWWGHRCQTKWAANIRSVLLAWYLCTPWMKTLVIPIVWENLKSKSETWRLFSRWWSDWTCWATSSREDHTTTFSPRRDVPPEASKVTNLPPSAWWSSAPPPPLGSAVLLCSVSAFMKPNWGCRRKHWFVCHCQRSRDRRPAF